MLMRALSVHIAHETAGAARIRHSLRPLTIEGVKFTCKPRTHRVARMRTHILLSSPGLTGRPSIPETSMIETRSRGVLDHPLSRMMTALCDAAPSASLRAQRSNPSGSEGSMDCFVANAPRNDRDLLKTPYIPHRSQNNPPYGTTTPGS